MPRIIVKKDGATIDQYIVPAGTVTVGRTPDNKVVLNDPSVSRSHVEIKLDADSRRITVTDLNSSNGTYVNGIKISRTIISKGTVGVGVYQLEVGNEEPAHEEVEMPVGDSGEATVMFNPDAIRAASASARAEQGHGSSSPAPSTRLMPGADMPGAGGKKKKGIFGWLFGSKK